MLLITAGITCRANAEPFVVKAPNGSIDWASGVITARGIGKPAAKNNKDTTEARAERFSAAMQNAGQNLFEIVKSIRINTDKYVENLSDEDPSILIKAREMVYETREVETKRKQGPDESLEVLLRFNIYGGFAQMVLPREIKQVESITKVLPGNKTPPEGPVPGVFSGLIVDARCLDANPAMVPHIFDEKGQAVYGPAFVSREFAVQKGMAGYLTTIEDAEKSVRVGLKPLMAKGLKTEGPGRCDFVISNSDAAVLRKTSEHLLFLRKCRVVIVLDAEK